MGFFGDRPAGEFLDDLCDFNRDGRIDPGEEMMRFQMFQNISEGRDPWDFDSSSDDEESDD